MSTLLVAIQFTLIFLILFTWSAIPSFTPLAFAFLIAGMALGLWTLCFNRIGNFNIRPEPKEGGRLITNGPYRFIRHPMYTALLLVMGAFAFFQDEPIKAACWILLFATLRAKSSLEEKMLKDDYPEYAHYQHSAGRFLPRLFRSHAGK